MTEKAWREVKFAGGEFILVYWCVCVYVCASTLTASVYKGTNFSTLELSKTPFPNQNNTLFLQGVH